MLAVLLWLMVIVRHVDSFLSTREQLFAVLTRVLCLSVSMPRTPKGHKRPADVVLNAVHVMRIATGEIEEQVTADGKNAAAVALGRKGGLARAKSVKKADRVKIARNAAQKRWKKRR